MPKFLDAPQWYNSSGTLVNGLGVGDYGSSGQVLTSNGTATPTWSTVSSSSDTTIYLHTIRLRFDGTGYQATLQDGEIVINTSASISVFAFITLTTSASTSYTLSTFASLLNSAGAICVPCCNTAYSAYGTARLTNASANVQGNAYLLTMTATVLTQQYFTSVTASAINDNVVAV